MKKYLVFDFDGVIADTFDININCSKKAGEVFTLEDFYAHHDGNVYEKPHMHFTPESVEKFFTLLNNYINSARLFISKNDFERLSEKYEIFIISSNKESIMQKFLSHYNIEKYFQEILGKESGKSKVQKFKVLFEKYNFGSKDCYFITDTLGDIREGHELGIQSIAVSYGYHSIERLQKGDPYKIVDTPEDLLTIL